MSEKLVPTEADRELYLRLRIFHTCPDEHIRAGVHDDIEELQWIAQHAAAARTEERERCAKIADADARGLNIAAAIRAGASA